MPIVNVDEPMSVPGDEDDTVAVLRVVLASQEKQATMIADGLRDVKVGLAALDASLGRFGDRLIGLLKWAGFAVFVLMAFLIAGILLVRGEDPRVAAEAVKVITPATSQDIRPEEPALEK